MDELDARFEAALSKFDGNNFDQLNQTDRILVTIWGIEAEINNGGFDQYYLNVAGDQAFFAPEALATIGAQRLALIVSEANSLFGPGGPPRSQDERRARLFELTTNENALWDRLDERFYSYPDDIRSLLEAFLSKSRGN